MSKSTGVYIKDDKNGWLPASVISYDDDETTATVSVIIPDAEGNIHQHHQEEEDAEEEEEVVIEKEERIVKLKDYEANTLPLQNLDEGGNLIEMADMCDLPSLHEAAILYNLKARHQDRNPYTRVGDIIIAVNPFQWIEGLYGDERRELYVDKLIWNSGQEADAKSTLPPHVYETSSLAYRGLAVDGQHQSILVSGESGAGKTETVKIVMSHLASVQEGSSGGGTAASDTSSMIVKRVLDSNPLLEAFGNAKTVRNDNSSRFGKYIQLQFDVEDATSAAFSGKAVPSCVLAGSACETYLLEKSRVVGHDEGSERTYHIFYQVLANASDEWKEDIWDGLVGATNESFRYVGESVTLKIEGRTDEESMERTLNALEVIGVVGDKMKTLMRAICTVMQLGNLQFGVDPDNDEGSVIISEDEMIKLASLMGVETDDISKALTTRTVIAGKERYTVPLRETEANDSRDAFAKEIYQQVFDWLVRTINDATSAETNYADAQDVEEFGLIGLLDIFGFESFQVNRFEQLCINYTNEKLQQKYTLDIFRSVQDEYDYEGIELGEIAFADNADVLNLVEGRMGIIAVLNEECVRPRGSDVSFVSKVSTVNKDISCLVREKLYRPYEFAVLHYAGRVKYDATNFVQKNNDAIPNDLLDCASKSSNSLIATELKAAAEAKALSTKPKPSGGGGAGGRSRRGGGGGRLTVATKFRSQLTSLMSNISKTRTRYIRCIKPNPEKVPLRMNLLSSAEQLRCAGVVSAVTISRVAYPNRLLHETALERFRCLCTNKDVIMDLDEKKEEEEAEEAPDGTPADNSTAKAVEALMKELLSDRQTLDNEGNSVYPFACGKTRVYFRQGALEHLESLRMVALGILATAVERIVRGFTARSKYLKLRQAAISSQAMARGAIARRRFMKAKKTCTILTCWVRIVFARVQLRKLKKKRACTQIQTRVRILQCVAKFRKYRLAAILIQKIARGSSQRPIYQAMLQEAREEAKVNSKLAALQKRLADAEMKWIQADKKRIEAEKRAADMSAGVVRDDDDGAGDDDGEAGDDDDADADALEGMEDLGDGEEKKEEQKALIDESGEMLEYLRKEVFKLRSKNYLLRTDLSELKESNQHLTEHKTSLEASFEALRQHANQLSQSNMKLIVQSKEQHHQVGELRKELNTTKFIHIAEVSKLRDEINAKDAAHEKEVKRLKRDLGKFQLVAEQSSLALARRNAAAASGGSSLSKVAEERDDPALGPSTDNNISISRPRSSLTRASFSKKPSYRTIHIDPDEDWTHDGYFTRYANRGPPPRPSNLSTYRGPHIPHRRFNKTKIYDSSLSKAVVTTTTTTTTTSSSSPKDVNSSLSAAMSAAANSKATEGTTTGNDGDDIKRTSSNSSLAKLAMAAKKRGSASGSSLAKAAAPPPPKTVSSSLSKRLK